METDVVAHGSKEVRLVNSGDSGEKEASKIVVQNKQINNNSGPLVEKKEMDFINEDDLLKENELLDEKGSGDKESSKIVVQNKQLNNNSGPLVEKKEMDFINEDDLLKENELLDEKKSGDKKSSKIVMQNKQINNNSGPLVKKKEMDLINEDELLKENELLDEKEELTETSRTNDNYKEMELLNEDELLKEDELLEEMEQPSNQNELGNELGQHREMELLKENQLLEADASNFQEEKASNKCLSGANSLAIRPVFDKNNKIKKKPSDDEDFNEIPEPMSVECNTSDSIMDIDEEEKMDIGSLAVSDDEEITHETAEITPKKEVIDVINKKLEFISDKNESQRTNSKSADNKIDTCFSSNESNKNFQIKTSQENIKREQSNTIIPIIEKNCIIDTDQNLNLSKTQEIKIEDDSITEKDKSTVKEYEKTTSVLKNPAYKINMIQNLNSENLNKNYEETGKSANEKISTDESTKRNQIDNSNETEQRTSSKECIPHEMSSETCNRNKNNTVEPADLLSTEQIKLEPKYNTKENYVITIREKKNDIQYLLIEQIGSENFEKIKTSKLNINNISDLCTFMIGKFTKIQENLKIKNNDESLNISQENEEMGFKGFDQIPEQMSSNESLNFYGENSKKESISKTPEAQNNQKSLSSLSSCVLAKWIDRKYYAGEIIRPSENGTKYFVLFGDGAKKYISKESIIFSKDEVLPVLNQNVFAFIDKDYEYGIVTSIEKNNKNILYSVKTESRTVQVSALELCIHESTAKIIKDQIKGSEILTDSNKVTESPLNTPSRRSARKHRTPKSVIPENQNTSSAYKKKKKCF